MKVCFGPSAVRQRYMKTRSSHSESTSNNFRQRNLQKKQSLHDHFGFVFEEIISFPKSSVFKMAFSNSTGLKSVYEKFRFRVWTVGPTFLPSLDYFYFKTKFFVKFQVLLSLPLKRFFTVDTACKWRTNLGRRR